MKFTKKPVTIEAVRWTGSNDSCIQDFVGEAAPWQTIGNDDCLAIKTLEGIMTAQPGDWIIKGVKGEFYPCKPDIFEATYSPAELHPAPTPAEQQEQSSDTPRTEKEIAQLTRDLSAVRRDCVAVKRVNAELDAITAKLRQQNAALDAAVVKFRGAMENVARSLTALGFKEDEPPRATVLAALSTTPATALAEWLAPVREALEKCGIELELVVLLLRNYEKLNHEPVAYREKSVKAALEAKEVALRHLDGLKEGQK